MAIISSSVNLNETNGTLFQVARHCMLGVGRLHMNVDQLFIDTLAK